MTARTQQDRTPTNNTPPANNALLPGQLFVEMGTPLRLWTGVPTSIAPAGNKLILDASQYVTSFNTRVGPVTLTGADITSAGGALLASPVFTGDPQAPTPPAGDADTSVATTAFVAAATATANHNTGRNLIHNPLFNVAQRGVGAWNTNLVYTSDRWKIYFSNGTLSVGVFTLTDGYRAQIGDEAAVYALNMTVAGSATAGSSALVFQPMEGVRRFAGKTVTVSFWASASVAARIGVSLDQNFGTGGSPSAAVSGVGQSVAVTLAMARYSLTFAIPSVSGKTVGTNVTDFTALNIWLSASSDGNAGSGSVGVQSASFLLWGVQLEIGNVATSLEKPDPRYDLSNCQRFYQLINILGTVGNQLATSQFMMGGVCSPTMRALPAVVIISSANSNLSGATYGANSQYAVYASGTSTANGTTTISSVVAASADL